MKALFDLCSVQLRDRLRKERKEKLWQPRHEESLAGIQKRLNDLNNNKPNAEVKKSASSETVSSTTNSNDNEENKEKEKPKNNDDVIFLLFNLLLIIYSYIFIYFS